MKKFVFKLKTQIISTLFNILIIIATVINIVITLICTILKLIIHVISMGGILFAIYWLFKREWITVGAATGIGIALQVIVLLLNALPGMMMILIDEVANTKDKVLNQHYYKYEMSEQLNREQVCSLKEN